jgi:hypothetical protein
MFKVEEYDPNNQIDPEEIWCAGVSWIRLAQDTVHSGLL